MLDDTETSATSRPSPIQSGESMLFAGASRAKTYRAPGFAPALPEPVRDSSGVWLHPFAWYDRSTSSWRTWQRCLIEGWETYSGRWPRAGMTRSGIAYRRQTLVPRTNATGFLLWPTLTANMGERGGRGDLLGLLRGYVYRGSHGNKQMRQKRALDTGQLNPDWADWYAGFPRQWTALEDSETPSFPK